MSELVVCLLLVFLYYVHRNFRVPFDDQQQQQQLPNEPYVHLIAPPSPPRPPTESTVHETPVELSAIISQYDAQSCASSSSSSVSVTASAACSTDGGGGGNGGGGVGGVGENNESATRVRIRERFRRRMDYTKASFRHGGHKLKRMLIRPKSSSAVTLANSSCSAAAAPDELRKRAERLAASARELGHSGSECTQQLEQLRIERDAADERWASGLERVAKRLEQLQSEQAVCVIDLEPLTRGQRVVSLPCSHQFHADCILPYLRTTPQCPIDRSTIRPEIIENLPTWTIGEDE